MNSGQLMTVLIVAIIAVMAVLRARYGASPFISRRMRSRHGWHDESQVDDPEKKILRDEVQALKERVAVLERIATDRSSTLERDIELLRDR